MWKKCYTNLISWNKNFDFFVKWSIIDRIAMTSLAVKHPMDTAMAGVIGNPIVQSMSPQIHREFARQTQRPFLYRALKAATDEFAVVAEKFFTEGGLGLNVTSPFKGDALCFADSSTQAALRAESANVLAKKDGGKIAAFNTDGAGLCADLRCNLKVELTDKKILVVGAGGAARGIVGALMEQNPREIVVVNGTVEKAEKLADDFSDIGCIRAGDLKTAKGDFQIVINATSAGLHGESLSLPEGVFRGVEIVYDLSYGEAAKKFLTQAKDGGALRVADGIGMLVEQAALSFAIWEGFKPTVSVVINHLKKFSAI